MQITPCKWLCMCLLFWVQAASAQEIKITDGRGKLTFNKAPERVAVINWALTEQLLALGIKPVGVADIEGYRKQGAKPDIPEGVVDLGNRLAPDYQALKALKPDIILVGYSQRPLLHTLENLGTVVYFKNFSHRYNNAEQAKKIFLTLAKLFDRTEYAEKVIQQNQQRISELKTQLEKRYKSELPKLTILMLDKNELWLFGNNSMPYYAARQLGLELTTKTKPTKFGIKKISVNDLPEELGCIMLFETGQNRTGEVSQHLKKETDCIYNSTPVNLYGGVSSIMIMAKSFASFLLK